MISRADLEIIDDLHHSENVGRRRHVHRNSLRRVWDEMMDQWKVMVSVFLISGGVAFLLSIVTSSMTSLSDGPRAALSDVAERFKSGTLTDSEKSMAGSLSAEEKEQIKKMLGR